MPVKSNFSFNLKTIAVMSTVMCTAYFGSFDPLMAQIYGPTIEASEEYGPSLDLEISLSAALGHGEIEGKAFSNPEAMKVFYQSRNNKPFWVRGYFFGDQDDELLEILQNSWTHGLNPEAYHLKELAALDGAMNFLKQTERELLLTDAFVRYARDMSGMRVDPSGLKIDDDGWRMPMSADEALALLNNGSVKDALESLTPKSQTYKHLQQELIRLSQEEEEPYASVLPLKFDRLVKPGQRHERIPDLRTRLGVEPLTQDDLLFDDRLAAALIKFQRENNLRDDGIIGSQTLDILNKTKADLIVQILANLERLRWVDETRPKKFVVVNVPSSKVWAIDNGKVEFEMDVIVGRPKRATEAFITEIRGMRFNPNWTIPPTIKKKDMLPKLKEDPTYFSNKAIEIFDGYGPDSQTLDPASIDWSTITRSELNGFRMVQTPGDHNALGRYRVLMPNEFNIYMHDTNQPELFKKSARAVSSGCIRLRDPAKMASFIMRDRKDWSDAKMRAILATGKTTERYIPDPIPVYVLYYTAWIDQQGRMVYGTDIYGQDKLLIEKLAKVDGFAIPGHNIKIQVRSDRSELASVN